MYFVFFICLSLQVIVYRTAFDEIQGSTVLIWFSLDYFADFIYLMDILIHFRTGKNNTEFEVLSQQTKLSIKVDSSVKEV